MKKIILLILSVLFLCAAAACADTAGKDNPYAVELNKKEVNLVEGDTDTLTAVVTKNNEETEATVAWKSSDTSVVTVSGGTITAVAEGTATVTASFEGASAACAVNVAKYYEPQLKVQLSNAQIRFSAVGQTARLTAETTIDGEKADVSVRFSSEDPEIASVTNEGLVTAVAKGQTKIVASAESNGYVAKGVCTILVGEFTENVVEETEEEYYVYYWDPDRTQSVPFAESVLGVTDEETGSALSYETADGAVKILSGDGLYGARRVRIEGENYCKFVTGIFVSGEIKTAEELVSMMNGKQNDYLVLANDIDMKDYLAEHPWNSTDTVTGAFFNFAFSGTLDGLGHSVLNLNSTAGLIARYTNVVFKEITAEGVLKNLHMQISIGLACGEAARAGLLFGDMYGTIDGCFFEVNAQFNVNWYMYGAAPIYNLSDTSKVTDTVFFIPNAAGLRMICSTEWGAAFEGMGVFDNVAFVYGDSGVNNSLPNKYNPNITNIYVVRADNATGQFNDAKVLNADKYAAAGAGGDTNSPNYWDAVSFDAITKAMQGFTFTESTLCFGDKTIVDYNEEIEISDAYQLAEGLASKPWGNFVLTNDIDMSGYLAENPWDWGTGTNNSDIRALFNVTFAGTLDGRGHSILNVTSTAGIIDRWENVVIREVSSTGVIKNLHMQVSLGVKATEFDRALLFGNMYGTIENCFFEIDVQTDSTWGYYGTAALYRVSDTTVVKNTAFYIPEPVDFRLMCASTAESKEGRFENVAYIYGNFNYKGLLPDTVNPDISDIYIIRQDAETGTFTDAKSLKAEYAAGSLNNDESLWEATTLGDITAAMTDAEAGIGFTFTEKTLSFGDTVIKDLSE